jgi:hypothetical protein
MSITENNNGNEREEIISPYQMFLMYIRSPKTVKEYSVKFDKFFNFLINTLGETEFKTNDIETKYFILYNKAKNNMNWFNSVLHKYIQFQKNRIREENLSGATFANYFKAIKKFCYANELEVKWNRILVGAPIKNRAAKDRPPTIEEIKKILQYGDRRIKFIVLIMCSSGMRIEGFEYLRWGNILPIEKDGKIVAAKIKIYEGDPEEYDSFITPETFFAIQDWMKYRKKHGEDINENSYIVRDLWDSTSREGTAKGFATCPKKLEYKSIKSILNRALWSQGLRTKLPPGKHRHPFQEAHGFRKFFFSQCQLGGMSILDCNKLTNHSNGINDSYYKPSDEDLLRSYLTIVDRLSIDQAYKLETQLTVLEEKNKENENLIKIKLFEKNEELEGMKEQINEMNKKFEKFERIFMLIQQNPNLSFVKPKILVEEID